MADELLDVKIVKTGRVYERVPLEKLRRWVAERRVLPDDLVRPVGATRWLRVATAPELASPAVQAPAQPTSPTRKPAAKPATAATGDLGIPAPAKTRPRRRFRFLEDTTMDMMPMIDVTFQLLIFFMFANQLANPNPIEVPEARYGRGIMPDGKQAILVDDQGRYYLGESTKPENIAPLEQVIRVVADNAASANGPLDVIISAHKASQHDQVRALMEKLEGVDNIGVMRLGVEERR
ncbi:MAG: biopolymer transporter ExbD [Candidatus Anammoximicrobium sp.]|nr:biopolymer transporter ExbD [Candidatus Anammoximicrobium sp.]